MKNIIEGKNCYLSIGVDKIYYEGEASSSHIDFKRQGAREMLAFLLEPKTVNDREIRSLNFGLSNVIDINLATHTNCSIILEMEKLKKRYDVYSNNIFQVDVENLIKLLKIYLDDHKTKGVIDIINKIKQVTRGKTNGKR